MTEISAARHEVPVDSDTTLEMLDRDPASVYRRLRRETPVVRIEAIGRIVLTKADDTYLAKTDTQHFHSTDSRTAMERAFGGNTLMRKDGLAHLNERNAMVSTTQTGFFSLSFHGGCNFTPFRKDMSSVSDLGPGWQQCSYVVAPSSRSSSSRPLPKPRAERMRPTMMAATGK